MTKRVFKFRGGKMREVHKGGPRKGMTIIPDLEQHYGGPIKAEATGDTVYLSTYEERREYCKRNGLVETGDIKDVRAETRKRTEYQGAGAAFDESFERAQVDYEAGHFNGSNVERCGGHYNEGMSWTQANIPASRSGNITEI